MYHSSSHAREETLSRHSYGLDLLKATAAFLIVLHHLQQDVHVHFAQFNFYGGRINFGFLVELFFMISGFLLFLSEQKKSSHSPKQSLAEAFIFRWERIWPMAALSILVYIPLCWGYKALTGTWIFGQKQGVWSAVASLFLIFAGGATRDIHGMNNPAWYLCVLLICYALFYISSFVAQRHKLPLWIFLGFWMLLGIGARSFSISLPFLQASTQRGYASFFLGALIAYVLPYITDCKTVLRLSFVMVIVALSSLLSGKLLDNQWAVVTFLLYPNLILVFYESTLINTLLAHKPIRFLGASSYAVYLWHTPLELFASLILALTGLNYVPSALSFVLCALGVECFGALIHLGVEPRLAHGVQSIHATLKASWQTTH